MSIRTVLISLLTVAAVASAQPPATVVDADPWLDVLPVDRAQVVRRIASVEEPARILVVNAPVAVRCQAQDDALEVEQIDRMIEVAQGPDLKGVEGDVRATRR